MQKEERHPTLYRAYRPQTFADARFGQEQVVDVLERSVKNGKVAHAYLFAGGRGTGKTSLARILAKSLKVSEKDLYEMDAASSRGIDDVRALREGVLALPFDSPYKFYIIDEAHMLTKEAWNALLKTLEEPPAHCIFVLATTERDKVPETIQSRCEVYIFKQPTREILAQTILNVAKKEGFALEPAAAELIALLAEGSFRDALGTLQKVLAISSGKKIALKDVEEISGAPRGETVRTIAKALAEKSSQAALTALANSQRENTDARILTKLLIHFLRATLLMRYAPELAAELGMEMGESGQALAKELSKSAAITSDTLRALLEANSRMAYAAVPALPLELAVIDICGETRS